MSKYSARFPDHIDPMHPGWYQTQVVHFGTSEKWGKYYNYWTGTDWTGIIIGAPDKASESLLLSEMQSLRDYNLNNAFYWRGLSYNSLNT